MPESEIQKEKLIAKDYAKPKAKDNKYNIQVFDINLQDM